MPKTCKQCHNPVNPNSKFCKVCGATLRKKSYSAPLTYSITSLLLVLAMVLGLWKPGYFWTLAGKNTDPGSNIQRVERPRPNIKITKSDLRKAELATGNVTPDQPVTQLNGVTINFSAHNLFGDNHLEVRKLAPKSDDDFGCTAQAYDFTLEGISEFATLVHITLPYENVPNAEDRMVVMYYNDKDKEWDYIPYTMDTQNHTVSFSTKHFSTSALFDMYQFDGDYAGPLTRATYNSRNLYKMITSLDSDLFYKMLQDKQIPLTESTSVTLGNLNNLNSATGHSLGAHSLLSPFTSEFSSYLGKKLGYLGIALVTLKVGTDWHNSQDLPETISENAYNLAEMGLSVGALTIGGVFLNVAAAGIWMYGLTSSSIQSYLDRGYDDSTEERYNYFSEHNVIFIPENMSFHFQLRPDQVRGMKDFKQYDNRPASSFYVESSYHWGLILNRVYKRYGNDPKKLTQIINHLLNDYTTVFWRISPNARKDYINDRSWAVRVFGWEDASNKKRQLYTQRLRARTIKKLEPIFKAYYELSMETARKDAYNVVFDMLDELNQVIEFKLEVEDEKGKKIKLSDSAYKDYMIVFDLADSTLPGPWVCNISPKAKTAFKCTLYSYLLAGSPSKLKLYKNEAEFYSGRPPEFETEFVTTLPLTTISLSDDLKFKDILGTWDMTQTVENYSSGLTDALLGTMENIPEMSEYLDQYKQIMGDVSGTYEGTMYISQVSENVADVELIHPGYEESGAVFYRGTWSEGQLQLEAQGQILADNMTLNFKKEGQEITCQGSSSFESDIASYSYSLTAIKR